MVKRYLDSVSQRRNFEAKNAAKLTVAILQIVIIILGFLLIFEINTSTVISLSALFGTAIGFATSVVVGNVVAGFYLISVRPFGIGDLIMVKGTEGIVMEIGLNYTKLMLLDESYVLIPNKSLLDANLINCSISLEDLRERAAMGHEISYQQILDDIGEEDDVSFKDLIREELLTDNEIVRYPFTIQLKLNIVKPDIALSDVRDRLDMLMESWHKKLKFKPRYYFTEYVFRQNVRIILVVYRAEQILTDYGPLLEQLYQEVFSELQEVN